MAGITKVPRHVGRDDFSPQSFPTLNGGSLRLCTSPWAGDGVEI